MGIPVKEDRERVVGAAPEGAADEHSAAVAVQRMFDEIAIALVECEHHRTL